ncbi:MAG: cobyrinate a,c-diamide synthase [Actinomycetota bacterium]|nr:cobyrinate a,c-diamide synthase [Actinomycetota bacterium]
MPALGPRLVIAGTHSGVGKTTVATALMAALTARGRRVAPAKVGPDFIDPSYHAIATGRPGRNLDAWMCGADAIGPLAGRAAAGADVLVVEGVMGLFDGAADGTPSSTAEVAVLLDAPVVLVVDASSMGQSVAALVRGFASHDERVGLAGVVLNRVGSAAHEDMLRRALEPLGVPVLAVLGRDDALTWRDRHLGLIPAAEHPERVAESVARLGAVFAAGADLDRFEQVARAAPARTVPLPPAPRRSASARIAVAGGPAFSFAYPDNLEALAAAGAELVPFDPCIERSLPEGCDGLVAGGGFPEIFGAELAENTPLLADVRRAVRGGLVVWAECGGLLWLTRRLDEHEMAGVIDAEARMTDRLTLGYRAATIEVASPLGPARTGLRGHEFHYSTTEPGGEALTADGRTGRTRGGYADERLLASYLHVHLGARPDLAERFVATCAPGRPRLDG